MLFQFKVSYPILYIFCLSITLLACEPKITCFDKPGEIIQQTLKLSEFDTLEINDNIHVSLHQSEEIKIIVEAPEKLIEGIDVQVKNGRLALNDLNECEWVQGFPQLRVHVYTPNLSHINFNGHGELTAKDTLSFDHLKIFALNSFGRIELLINNRRTIVKSNSSTSIKLSGKTGNLYFYTSLNDGSIDASSLEVNDIFFSHTGENDIEVKAIHSIKGEIHNVGNIILYGAPSKIDITRSGSGHLVLRK